MIWLRIDSAPVRQIVRDSTALPFVDAGQAVHQLLTGVGALRSTGTGNENTNVSISLNNTDAQASRLFASRPPIGAAATLMDDATAIYAGVIKAISLGADTSIEIES